MDQQRILEKIKKCFALSKSTNKHEAAIALKQAYALAKQHGIDNPELSINISNTNLINTKSISERMDCKLIQLVQNTFKVLAVVGGKKVRFFGYDYNVTIAGYIFDVLSKLLKKARHEFLDAHTDNRMKKQTKTRRADLFCDGWINAIADEILKFQPVSDAELTNEDTKLIKSYITNFYNKELRLVEPKKSHDFKDADYSAYHKGKTAGNNVTINRGVNNDDSELELLT